jgi:exodeoxyribonuclease V alpha subunit
MMEQLTGTIDRLFFSSPGFSAGLLEDDGGTYHKFGVKSLVNIGQYVQIVGEWGKYKGKPNFNGVGVIPDMPDDATGLARWLTIDKRFKGIGPVKGQILADAVESVEDFDRLIRTGDGIATLHERTRIPEEMLQIVRNEWIADEGMHSALVNLADLGIGPAKIRRIVDILGPEAYEIIKEDPYVLCDKVPGFAFTSSDEIATKLGTEPDSESRAFAAFKYILRQGADDGHTCMLVQDVIRESILLLTIPGYAPDWDTLDIRLAVAPDVHPRVIHDELYVQHYLYAEQENFLDEILTKYEDYFDEDADVDTEIVRGAGEAQEDGIMEAIRRKISVITGSAGTGKTWTVTRICEAAEFLGKRAILLAPTGKAAERLREVTGRGASTIHRLLWYDGVRFNLEKERMPDDAVFVVDEASMCNVSLVWELVSRINFATSSLVLVGDHHQLPPIGPGCPLQDVIQEGLATTTELTVIRRQAGELKENCTQLLDGHVARPSRSLLLDLKRDKLDPWYVVDDCADPLHVRDIILDMYRPELLADLGLALTDIKILTPMRKKSSGPLSLTRLNAKIQEVVHKRFYGDEIFVADDKIQEHSGPPVRVNDPVVFRRNIYSLGIMNGSTGIVTEIKEPRRGKGRRVIVNFGTDKEPMPIELEEDRKHLQYLEVAYATTIHQSQGSEFPVSVVVVHWSHMFMLHRQLFYTACTRAQRSCIILGDQKGINYAANHTKPSERQTWLALKELSWKQSKR